jgi:ABC-type lipoprotein export system ATPase subunit
MEKILELKNGNKEYITANEKIIALDNVNLKLELGKIYLIYGHSGSGKSTLIHVLGLLDKLDSGSLLLDNEEINNLNEKEKAKIRMNNIGFVFQSYFLDKQINALENVMMPMYINSKIKKQNRKYLAEKLLKLVGLEKRMMHFPNQLSGGEQQRVAIARALSNDPTIILADEPTGNLDKTNEENIIDIFIKLKKLNKCIVIVTHNENLKQYADVIYEMDNGKLKEVKNENS